MQSCPRSPPAGQAAAPRLPSRCPRRCPHTSGVPVPVLSLSRWCPCPSGVPFPAVMSLRVGAPAHGCPCGWVVPAQQAPGALCRARAETGAAKQKTGKGQTRSCCSLACFHFLHDVVLQPALPSRHRPASQCRNQTPRKGNSSSCRTSPGPATPQPRGGLGGRPGGRGDMGWVPAGPGVWHRGAPIYIKTPFGAGRREKNCVVSQRGGACAPRHAPTGAPQGWERAVGIAPWHHPGGLRLVGGPGSSVRLAGGVALQKWGQKQAAPLLWHPNTHGQRPPCVCSTLAQRGGSRGGGAQPQDMLWVLVVPSPCWGLLSQPLASVLSPSRGS